MMYTSASARKQNERDVERKQNERDMETMLDVNEGCLLVRLIQIKPAIRIIYVPSRSIYCVFVSEVSSDFLCIAFYCVLYMCTPYVLEVIFRL